MRTIKIEIRCDLEDPEKDKIMIQAAREAAKTLLATVALISGKRRPQIVLETGDMFHANAEIDLLTDDEIGDEVTRAGNAGEAEGEADAEV